MRGKPGAKPTIFGQSSRLTIVSFAKEKIGARERKQRYDGEREKEKKTDE